MKNRSWIARIRVLLFILAAASAAAAAEPVTFTDAAGRAVSVKAPPRRVVCLVPAVSELLAGIGVEKSVVATTFHDQYPAGIARTGKVGGYAAPSISRIRDLDPDLVLVSRHHQAVKDAFTGGPPAVAEIALEKVSDIFEAIDLLGRIFDREEAALGLSEKMKADFLHIQKKAAAVPVSKRVRVMRFMGRDKVMTHGDNTFQNELVRMAGGIPPVFGRPGPVVAVSLDEWRDFNPQVIYACPDDRPGLEALLHRPGWDTVDAVKTGRILYFPCDLTCRLSARAGDFAGWLSTSLYEALYENLPPAAPDERLGEKPLSLDLPFVRWAGVVSLRLFDFVHKSLLVTFNEPMAVVSTLEGFREGVGAVGNCFTPPPVWSLNHRIGLEKSRERLLFLLGRSHDDTSLLFTGADMDHLTVKKETFREMAVTALVTAGVHSNALRMGKDTGPWYEPGTINILVLPGMRLTPRAMNRAVISATEAKTAALWDLDVRSSATPARNGATGTGTDNIIVVEGRGRLIDNAGGHSKMGELIAKAVYAGVKEAVFRQNGLFPERDIHRRLSERGVDLYGIASSCPCAGDPSERLERLEALLLTPRYAGFLASALSLSDAWEAGQVADLSAFSLLSRQMAEEIAGGPIESPGRSALTEPLPEVLKIALGALLDGIAEKERRTPLPEGK